MNIQRRIRYARRFRNWRELARARDAGEKPHSLVLRSGLLFDAPDNVNVVRAVTACFFKAYYTPRGFEIGSEDVVVDAGASIGAFAVYAALRTRGRVVAIEPSPVSAAYLRRNVERSGCRVEVIEGALADRDGHVTLHVRSSGLLHSLMEPPAEDEPVERVEVPSLSLATLMEKLDLDRIDLLKMDCEGSEGLVLGAAPEGCLRRVRRIAMEFHDDSSPMTHEEMGALLERFDFETGVRWDGKSPTGYLYARARNPTP